MTLPARAEVVIDVEILEVNRQRAKQYGLNLSEYALGGVLSPEVNPGQPSTSTTATVGDTVSPSSVMIALPSRSGRTRARSSAAASRAIQLANAQDSLKAALKGVKDAQLDAANAAITSSERIADAERVRRWVEHNNRASVAPTVSASRQVNG